MYRQEEGIRLGLVERSSAQEGLAFQTVNRPSMLTDNQKDLEALEAVGE